MTDTPVTQTVRGAVAKRDEEAAAKPPNAVQIKRELARFRPIIAKLLNGTGVTEETFTAWVANALRAQPKLWGCDPDTVIGSALKCAQLGLAPNDGRNLAWIIPYGHVAQFQLGYGGVMELARRAVPGLRFDGQAVHPNDEFDVDYGKAEPLTHRPAVAMQKPRGGDAYAWYVRAVFPDGSAQVQVLDKEQVEYHRLFSKQPNGEMWTKSYSAGALKSCVLDMRRWLPASAQLSAAIVADEQSFTPTELAAEVEVIEATYDTAEAGE